jgi:hypothetical protein
MKQAIWRKYIDLCGDIDIEITVPELIKSNDLAEHQDYIFFNYPNRSQLKDIESVKCKIDEFVERVRSSEKLIAAVSLHDGIIDVSTKLTYFISNFDYYLAMLKFLHFPKKQFINCGREHFCIQISRPGNPAQLLFGERFKIVR